MLSGGALLLGDLARPDLLGGDDEVRAAARTYCHTVQDKILWRLPDHVEVFPTHVSGSLCGGNIGSRLSTTVGFERKTNAILARVSSSEEFVEECVRLDNLPAVPPRAAPRAPPRAARRTARGRVRQRLPLSAVASFLAASGRAQVVNVTGGMGGWNAAGYPTTTRA